MRKFIALRLIQTPGQQSPRGQRHATRPELLARHLSGELHQIKALFSAAGIVFGSIEEYHDQIGNQRVKYRQDGKGNALAVIMSPGRFEIRGDRRVSAASAREWLDGLLRGGALKGLEGYEVLYQGRRLGRIRKDH